MANRPLLSWKLKDYQENGIEAPEILEKNPDKTEGELMSDDELRVWFQDCFKTLTVIKGENEKVFQDLRNVYILDIQYLTKIERISENILDELLEDDILN